jgi:hypothetical protein
LDLFRGLEVVSDPLGTSEFISKVRPLGIGFSLKAWLEELLIELWDL